MCNTTVLRDIHRTILPSHENVQRIGVDDWAFRKGVDYGSIVIDMDSGHPIDLLGDRGHDSFKPWLDSHPEVVLVSRDRGQDNEHDSEIISKLFALSWFEEMFAAAKTYYSVMKGENAVELYTWVDKYKNSSVKQIRTLALGISFDINAVAKAVTTNIRNGITEGFVNKLKEVK